MSFIYMLKSKNRNGATKTYRYRDDGLIARVSNYNAGYEFTAAKLPRQGEIDNIAALSELLTSAEDEPEWFAIRGELRSGQEYVSGVNRQCLDKNDNPHWMEPTGGQRWLTIDIDDMPMPDSMSGSSPREVAIWAAGELPDALRGVSFHYHHSSSAGLTKLHDKIYKIGSDEVRVHLSFIIDRAVCSRSIRGWVREHASAECPMDAALFNPVQPHFTADPIFEGGPDPLAGKRSGLVRLDRDEVCAPSSWMSQRDFEESQAAHHNTVRMFASTIPSRSKGKGYYATALASAEQNIRSAREGTRHDTVYRESAAIGELVHKMDEHQAVASLTAAAQSTVEASRHADMARTVADAIEQGKLSPRQDDPLAYSAHGPGGDAPSKTIKSMADMKTDRFRVKNEPNLPDSALDSILEMADDQQRDVYALAESYHSLGWTHPVDGPINELDAIITAHTVIEYELDRNTI